MTTVLDLVHADPATVRRKFSVVVERTVRELQGTQCIDLEHMPQPKQEIACTRSFGHPITYLHELAEAVTEFASRAEAAQTTQSGRASPVLHQNQSIPVRPPVQPVNHSSVAQGKRRYSADRLSGTGGPEGYLPT